MKPEKVGLVSSCALVLLLSPRTIAKPLKSKGLAIAICGVSLGTPLSVVKELKSTRQRLPLMKQAPGILCYAQELGYREETYIANRENAVIEIVGWKLQCDQRRLEIVSGRPSLKGSALMLAFGRPDKVTEEPFGWVFYHYRRHSLEVSTLRDRYFSFRLRAGQIEELNVQHHPGQCESEEVLR